MSGWGDRLYDVHFNEANARRVAEAEAERDRVNLRRGIAYALLFSAPIWALVAVVVAVVWLW